MKSYHQPLKATVTPPYCVSLCYKPLAGDTFAAAHSPFHRRNNEYHPDHNNHHLDDTPDHIPDHIPNHTPTHQKLYTVLPDDSRHNCRKDLREPVTASRMIDAGAYCPVTNSGLFSEKAAQDLSAPNPISRDDNDPDIAGHIAGSSHIARMIQGTTELAVLAYSSPLPSVDDLAAIHPYRGTTPYVSTDLVDSSTDLVDGLADTWNSGSKDGHKSKFQYKSGRNSPGCKGPIASIQEIQSRGRSSILNHRRDRGCGGGHLAGHTRMGGFGDGLGCRGVVRVH
jgi:hypothetical protein